MSMLVPLLAALGFGMVIGAGLVLKYGRQNDDS